MLVATMTDIRLFDYDLPPEYIAQTPTEPRDASKLLVMDRATGVTSHRIFRDIVDLLRPGDVVVFNTSKVFKARIVQDGVEIFVLRMRDGEADVLLRPGKKFAVGSLVFGKFEVQKKHEDGIVTVTTNMTIDEMLAYCDAHGTVPTPPYVTTNIEEARYQTVYAKCTGSVAAPTAGLHFTPELLERIRAKGVAIEKVTLHVGIGTFRPVQAATLEEHVMHSEWVEIDDATAARIVAAKSEHRRVIAVGTTTVRVLEVVAKSDDRSSRGYEGSKERGKSGLRGYSGEVNLFITPGFQFEIIDGLVTNFHLPKSTLLVLVSAFAGRDHVLAAYDVAKRQDYRFFSFGDAMFIA